MKKIDGYMTVEASLVMSIVLVVYLFLIRYGLWAYDRCVLEQDMQVLLVSYCAASEEEQEIVWQKLCKNWDKEKYIWIKPAEPMLKQKGWTLELLEEAGGGDMGNIALQYEMYQLRPVQWLRIKRKIKL